MMRNHMRNHNYYNACYFNRFPSFIFLGIGQVRNILQFYQLMQTYEFF